MDRALYFNSSCSKCRTAQSILDEHGVEADVVHYLGLEAASSDQLLEAITAHPILLERPIFVVGDKAVIARPPELLLELL